MSDTPNRFDDRLIPASGVHDFGADESDDLNMTVPASATAPTTTSLSLFFDEGSPAGVPSASNYDATPGRAPMRITLDELDITGEQKEPMLFQISMTGSKEAPIGSNDSAPEETQGSIPVKGLEVIAEDNVPPPCIVEIEAIATSRKKLEVIQDDNNPPEPFNFQWMEAGSYDTESIKKGKPSRMNRLEVEEENAFDTVGDNIALKFDSCHQLGSVPSHFNEVHVDTDIDLEVTEGVSFAQETINNESADSPIHIPEAFLVEETGSDDVVIATVLKPRRPWWRQRRMQLLLGTVLSIVTGLAVYIGVSRKNQNEALLESFYMQSLSPTSFPSPSPTTCAHVISIGKQVINTTLEHPYQPQIAIDGSNLVIAVRDGGVDDGSPVHILFYSLANNGIWQLVQREAVVDLGDTYSVATSGNTTFVGFPSPERGNGEVIVYEKIDEDWEKIDDPFIHDVDSYYLSFGTAVLIDGNLAAVQWSNMVQVFHRENKKWVQFDEIDGSCPCSITGDTLATFQWNSTIADWRLSLFNYNKGEKRLDLIQDPFPTGDPHLSGNYLAYWDVDKYNDGILEGLQGDGDWDVFIYQRGGPSYTYNFIQRLNVTGNHQLAFDGYIIVVGGDDYTEIYSWERGNNWSEVITLDQAYDFYYLSGQILVTESKGAITSFDIEECIKTQLSTAVSFNSPTAAPSLTPSLSIPPSISPTALRSSAPSLSLNPSASPSTSLAPSLSSSPTETCYWVNITVVYDAAPWEVAWYLQRVVMDQLELVTWNTGYYEKLNDTKSICLQEGEYGFIIGDYYGNGICCSYGNGQYTVTLSDDVVVAEGGVFGYKITTYFTIPFINNKPATPPATSNQAPHSSPTSSPSSSSTRQTMPPPSSATHSSSQPPTETCYWVDIAVQYGDYKDYATWSLFLMVDFGSDILIADDIASEQGDIPHRGPICLQSGMYWFTFQGPYMVYYNITTTLDGALITEGTGKYFDDTTIFSIPFVPPEFD